MPRYTKAEDIPADQPQAGFRRLVKVCQQHDAQGQYDERNPELDISQYRFHHMSFHSSPAHSAEE